MEQYREKTGNEQVPFLHNSNKCPTDIQDSRGQILTTPDGDTGKSPLMSTTPLIEERLLRDEHTNDLYLPITSTVVLKRKQTMPYLPLDFDNNLTIDALVDSRAFVSAIAQNEMDTIKQNDRNNIFKIDDAPNFQKQVANSQLETSLATTTLEFDIGDNTFAEHFVVMRKLTGPIVGLFYMRNNSVVIDTTHGFIHFPYLTMQNETTSEMSAKPQAVLIDDALTIPPRTTKTITAVVDHPSE